MTNPVQLTIEDWVEIAAALWSKQNALDNGDYGGETHTHKKGEEIMDCEACENIRWIEHLKTIQKKIGEDGDVAAACGVAPAKEA